MPIISFATEALGQEWEHSATLSEALRNAVRCIALRAGGLTITCLERTAEHNREVHGVPGSKHVATNNRSGKASAADFIFYCPSGADGLQRYLDQHLPGLQILYHNAGNGLHWHLECDPPPGLQVEMRA